MSQSKIIKKKYNVNLVREKIRYFYYNHYYNLFMNLFDLKHKDLTPQRKQYFKNKLWCDGAVAGSKEKITDKLVFSPFSVWGYDIDNFPKKITLIDVQQTGLLKTGELYVDEEAVICYVQSNKKSIYSMIEPWINEIVEIQLTINVNLFVHNMPLLIGGDSIDKNRLENLVTNIYNHEPYFFADITDIEKLKNLINNVPYIIDKLNQYIDVLDSRILTFLGIDNNQVMKAEREVVDEVNANNSKINYSGNCIIKHVEEFFERVKEVLNEDVKVISNIQEVKSVHESKAKEDNEDVDL